MRRLILFLLTCVYVGNAGATTVCAQTDKVVIGLHYATVPISYEADNENSEWRVHYDGIGTVSGVSSCVPFFSDGTKCDNENRGYFGNGIGLFYGGCPFAQSGHDAKSNYQGRRDGNMCWCKITHPFESEWISIWLYEANCATTCAKGCASSGIVQNYMNFRYSAIMVTGMDDDYTISFK